MTYFKNKDQEKVIVKYQTLQKYCHCCNQKLPNPVTSEVREFKISKENCLEWLEEENWRIEADYEEEFNELIMEFVLETIGFFATNSAEKVIVFKEEFEFVKQFILEKVIA